MLPARDPWPRLILDQQRRAARPGLLLTCRLRCSCSTRAGTCPPRRPRSRRSSPRSPPGRRVANLADKTLPQPCAATRCHDPARQIRALITPASGDDVASGWTPPVLPHAAIVLPIRSLITSRSQSFDHTRYCCAKTTRPPLSKDRRQDIGHPVPEIASAHLFPLPRPSGLLYDLGFKVYALGFSV